jgi:hypothetical protein
LQCKFDIARKASDRELEQTRFHFLRTDLALCLTYLDGIRIRIRCGDLNDCYQSFINAEEGYAGIARSLPILKDAAHRIEIEQGLEKLRAALDDLAPLARN